MDANSERPIDSEDSESDPDFINNAKYEYDRSKPRRSHRNELSKGTQRRDVLVKTKRTAGTRSKSITHNPLLEFFKEALVSIPQDDNTKQDEEDESEDDKEDSNDLRNTETRNKLNADIDMTKAKSIDVAEDSVTESESDFEPMTDLGRLRESNKKNDHESVTESDNSGDEGDFTTIPRAATGPVQVYANDGESSVTESESEAESLSEIPGWQVRPSFKRSTPAYPLVLDQKSKIKVPKYINAFLREYQREGIRFFYERWKEGRGGILGDDMGLGKTVQVISFLSAIMKKQGHQSDIDRRRKHVSRLQDGVEWEMHRRLPPANKTWPTCLIVAPSSVVPNWERELETWGFFEFGVYVGQPKERELILSEFKKGRLDLVVTSFDVARRDIDILYDLAWSCIIVDEAHRIKNAEAKLTDAFNSFECQVRFGLTGTAIQNSYRELWTILDWSNPGRLGDKKQWNSCVTKPLLDSQSSKATEEEREKGKRVARVLVENILPRFFLRRTKDVIKDQLQQKVDHVVFCPLTAQQIEVYKRILEIDEVKNMMCKDDLCDCGSRKPRAKCHYPWKTSSLFHYMSVLIKISNHLSLILPTPSDNEEQTVRNRELSRTAFGGHAVPKYVHAMLIPQYCGKWQVLNTLLAEWRKDSMNKVLIFTKSVKLLDILDYHLSHNHYPFCRLDGGIKPSERMPIIDKFNDEKAGMFIFLISTMAGGTGLNLTSANKVVVFDPNWNPAHDLQAMDRAYRFGQTRDVHVYRLLGAGSIEELIYARQVYKQQQMKIGYEASNQTRYFSGVQGDSSKRGELFGLQNVFKLHENTLATKMAIEKANLAEFDWALAHMEGKSNSGTVDDKRRKDENDFRGVTSLLLDDSAPITSQQEVDDIHRILNGGVVQYYHRNDTLFRPSRVEAESLRAAQKRPRKSTDSGRNVRRKPDRSSSPAKPEWPPRRRHHNPPLSPNSKLKMRQKALLEMGYIKNETQLPNFAVMFGEMNPEDQERVLGRLDQHIRQQRAKENRVNNAKTPSPSKSGR